MYQKQMEGDTSVLADRDFSETPDSRREGRGEKLLKAGKLDPRLTQRRDGTEKSDSTQGLESMLAEPDDRGKEADDSALQSGL